MAHKNVDGSPRDRHRAAAAASPRHSLKRGMLAFPTGSGHYAGCKWTDPPLSSKVPLPPQHWMQAPHSHTSATLPIRQSHLDIDTHLKVLLKVQA